MFKRPLVLLLGLAAFLAVGCAGSRNQFSLWPSNDTKKGPPGVVSPTEQLGLLRELASKSESRTAQQKQQVADLLLSMLSREQDPLLRAEIIRTLRKFPTPESLAAAQNALKDPDADVRVAACEALGRMGGSRAVGGLSEALRGDVDVDVRMAAARALGETRDTNSLVALGAALDDKDPAMQYRAMASLKTVTGKDLGNDVRRWQQFVKGETPEPTPPASIAERMRQMFR